MRVKISTQHMGVGFATTGVIKPVGRVSAADRKAASDATRSLPDRPYGFTTSALADALSAAQARGWTVVNAEVAL